MPQTPLKYWLSACLLMYCCITYAQDKEALPIDLIELLGELDDDDQATLDSAMKEIENKSANAPKTQSNVEVGVKK